MQKFIDTWQINNNVNLYLIKSIDEHHFLYHPVKKTSPLADQFVHMHNTRVLWIAQNDPQLVHEIVTLNNTKRLEKSDLVDALHESGQAISTLLERSIQKARFNGFKTPLDFLNYMLALEAQNRNNIIISLAFVTHHN